MLPSRAQAALRIGRRQHTAAWDFWRGEYPPELEELDLFEYPGGHEPTTAERGSIRAINCVGYPGKRTEMDYWADNFDWSRL